ncbi:Protein FAM65A [Liparis tanakae]|uniref:Protein FAM65A n=1 Tax=Liparis tanakae TaxID=230148 RepID=A0A4Z2JCW8_9TELE|nr:Protein FAM65A [Liparis tanakae]
MFTGSTKLPPTKTPQPERLDEVYAALRRGLQSYLQVHQLELESLGQQSRENKRNGRLGSLYELDKVSFTHTCCSRDPCSTLKLYEDGGETSRSFTMLIVYSGDCVTEQHMCSLESELESQMGEFHVKMKGLAGFARLCAGDQYEVLMRYGRQRWRLRGRVEVSNKQIWDGEEYVFLPLVTELLSIKVTELKSLANHVVVGSVSCEMLDLFCPLPQTLAVDINDLGTVKLNLEVTWSPFDKDDQTSSSSTVSKRLLSNQSPPDTPSMREQVFYSLLKRQGETENGTVWSNSSESSDDSSSPALAHHAQRLTASNMPHSTLPAQPSFTPHKPSAASTPSLSSNREEREAEAGEVFTPADAVPNGHLLTSCSHSPDRTLTDRAPVPPADLSGSSADPSCSRPDVSSAPPASLTEAKDLSERGVPRVCVPAKEGKEDACEDSAVKAGRTDGQTRDGTAAAGGGRQVEASEDHRGPLQSVQEAKPPAEAPAVSFPTSSSFTLEVETALESFDFLNCSDLEEEEEEEEEQQEDKGEKKEEDKEQREDKGEKKEEDGQHEENQNKMEEEKVEDEEHFYSARSDEEEEEEADALQILMEAPEGFRNSDEDRFSESQESSVGDVQDLCQMDMPEEREEHGEEKGDEKQGEDMSHGQEERPATPTQLATTVS